MGYSIWSWIGWLVGWLVGNWVRRQYARQNFLLQVALAAAAAASSFNREFVAQAICVLLTFFLDCLCTALACVAQPAALI